MSRTIGYWQHSSVSYLCVKLLRCVVITRTIGYAHAVVLAKKLMMSWTNSSSTLSNSSRSSIFETFNAHGFGDDEIDRTSQTVVKPTATVVVDLDVNESARDEDVSGDIWGNDDDVQCESIEDENAATTLWMSCSPGRDFTDDEVDSEDDEDDLLPLSQLQTSKSQPVKKTSEESKKASKRKPQKKTEKSGNAQKKPMTAYALFFRETQASVKAENPHLLFGDISRILASTWENMEASAKQAYTDRAEELKQSHLKELDEGGGRVKTKTKSSSQRPKQPPNKAKGSVLSDDSDSRQSSASDQSIGDRPLCIRNNCRHAAVVDTRWDNDFCSVACVVTHCRDNFNAWVSSSLQHTKSN